MTDFASFAGLRLFAGSIIIPLYGMWSADISFASVDAATDNGQLVMGDLALQGHLRRQAVYGGARHARLVAGTGGWPQMLAARQYKLSSGVMRGMVLRDAAREVGESVEIGSDSSVGSVWTREAGPAERTLRALAGSDWHTDSGGTVRIEPWPSTAINVPFDVVEHHPASGRITLATEHYAAWMPGTTFRSPFVDGVLTNRGVRFFFDDKGTARVEVMTT